MKLGKQSAGLTLIELMVGVAILAIIATVAAPAVGDFIRSARVRGAAEGLVNDLIFARSEAVLRNRAVTVSFSGGTTWCYGIHDNGNCNCSTSGSCNIKEVPGTRYPSTSLTTGFTSLTFDPVQGTITGTPGTIGTDTIMISNEIGTAGAKPGLVGIKLCSPSGHATMGYPSC